MELRYNVHVQNKGWLYDENDSADWPKNGAYAGTRGESLRISPGTKIQYYAGCTGFDVAPWNETGKYPINVLDAWINNTANDDNN